MRSFNSPSLKSQSGQIIVEYILMMVVAIAIATAVTQKIRGSNLLASVVEGPWAYIDGMARYGVWDGGVKAKAKDPNLAPRRGSMMGENEQ